MNKTSARRAAGAGLSRAYAGAGIAMSGQRQIDREHLLRYPVPDRGVIAGWFHEACRREGARTPTDVVAAVRRRALAVIADPPDPTRKDRARALLGGLEADPKGARELAQSVIEWNALPGSERDRLKADRANEHRRAYMATLPVTEKQRAYLDALGCDQVPANRLAASELIDQLRRKVEVGR